MKHAIVVFTKIPEAGKVKSRLTKDHGGILTTEEASNFYKACLINVINTCTSVDRANVWICYNKDGNRGLLNDVILHLNQADRIAGIFPDLGETLDECMQYAAEFLLMPGRTESLAKSVLIVNGDMLGLQPVTLNDALDKLETISSTDGILIHRLTVAATSCGSFFRRKVNI